MSSRGTTEAPERTSSSAPAELPIVERDVRRKRPPALSFLLRMDTLRRVTRALSLLALDFAALFLAILTALCLKAAARDAWNFHVSFNQTKDYVTFAFLVFRDDTQGQGPGPVPPSGVGRRRRLGHGELRLRTRRQRRQRRRRRIRRAAVPVRDDHIS